VWEDLYDDKAVFAKLIKLMKFFPAFPQKKLRGGSAVKIPLRRIGNRPWHGPFAAPASTKI